jgi:predicted outer membrane protein
MLFSFPKGTTFYKEKYVKNKKIWAVTATAALCLSLTAAAGGKHSKSTSWSNSLSDEPRSADAPPPVVEDNIADPWDTAMYTVDTTPGVLSAAGQRKERAQISRNQREGFEEDRTVYRSGAPAHTKHTGASNLPNAYHGFAYGDDIAVLKGLQLELALNQMHHMNQSEIGLAKMAESKAKTPSVLNLAHQIRADHEKMEKKVEELADARNVRLERYELNTYEKVVRNRLNRLSAPDFETAFLRVVDRNHDIAAANLRMIRDDLNDEQVTQVIDDALPVMYSHKENSAFDSRARIEDEELGE